MSHTDNTRPYDIQAEDPTLPRTPVEHGRPLWIRPDDHEFQPVYYGGINSFRRTAKTARRELHRRSRAHKRQMLHRILRALDLDAADTSLSRTDRRTLVWSLT